MVRATRIFRSIGLAALLLAAHAGCVQKLDLEGLVKDLRILGIRAEPAELVDDPLPGTVSFEALVLDPRLDDPFAVEIEWQFCPVASENFCRDFDDKVADLTQGFSIDPPTPGGGGEITVPGYPDCPASSETIAGLTSAAAVFGEIAEPNYLDRYRDVVTGPDFSIDVGGALQSVDLGFLESVSADLEVCGEPPPDFALPQETSDLHLYHFATNPLESLLGVWPTVILSATASGETLVAQKRLPLIFRHPANPLLLLRTLAPSLDLGVNVCAPGTTGAECLAVETHVANRNPVFLEIRTHDGGLAGSGTFETYWSAAEDGPDPLVLEPRQIEVDGQFRIEPVFTDDSQETFQRFTADPSTLEISVLEEQEEIVVSWFATGGWFREELTWVSGTVSLDAGMVAPEEPGIVQVFLVARDQRGGTTWISFGVEAVE